MLTRREGGRVLDLGADENRCGQHPNRGYFCFPEVDIDIPFPATMFAPAGAALTKEGS